MNEINKEEMFGHLKSFLKTKGIEIQDGSYADGIRKGCEILTDTVNMSQRAFDKAKDTVGKGLDQVRQTVHERTAPKSQANPSGAKTKASSKAGATKSSAKAKTSSTKQTKKRGK